MCSVHHNWWNPPSHVVLIHSNWISKTQLISIRDFLSVCFSLSLSLCHSLSLSVSYFDSLSIFLYLSFSISLCLTLSLFLCLYLSLSLSFPFCLSHSLFISPIPLFFPRMNSTATTVMNRLLIPVPFFSKRNHSLKVIGLCAYVDGVCLCVVI